MLEDILEELAEELSLRLAQKLRNGEISIEKMAEACQIFSYKTSKIKTEADIEEIKKFVENI